MNIIGNIFSFVYLGYIIVLIYLNFKGKVRLVLHPILAIMQGIMVTFTVNYLLLAFIQNLTVVTLIGIGILLALSIFIGGFVSTIFSRDNKAFYGIITGIIFSVFILILDYKDFIAYSMNMKLTIGFIIIFIVSMLPGGIGGFIARKSNKSIIIRTNSYLDEYTYCIGKCDLLTNNYNQLLNGENIHITQFILDCEDLIHKFNGLNNLGVSKEINKSIMVGTLKNMVVHVKMNYMKK